MVRHLSIVATFWFAAPLLAHSPPASSPTSAPTIAIRAFGQEIQKTPDQSWIRANVSLVSTSVVVRDAKGKLAMGLSEEDFRVFDNGVEQTLEAVEMSGAPLSVAIVVENSRVSRRCSLPFVAQECCSRKRCWAKVGRRP
jgi:hypothetical protein